MPLGEFSIICFEFLGDFWRKSQKKRNWAFQAPSPQRRAPLSRQSTSPQRRLPRRGEAEGQNGHPMGSLQRSCATPQRSA